MFIILIMIGTSKEVDDKQKDVDDEYKTVEIITALIVEKKDETSVNKAET